MSNLRQITLFYRTGQVICNCLTKGKSLVMTEKILYQDILLPFSMANVKQHLFEEDVAVRAKDKTVIDGLTLIFEQGEFVGVLAIIKKYVDLFKEELKSSIKQLERLNRHNLENWNNKTSKIQYEKYFENLAIFMDEA